jgi:hypothetical protein
MLLILSNRSTAIIKDENKWIVDLLSGAELKKLGIFLPGWDKKLSELRQRPDIKKMLKDLK